MVVVDCQAVHCTILLQIVPEEKKNTELENQSINSKYVEILSLLHKIFAVCVVQLSCNQSHDFLNASSIRAREIKDNFTVNLTPDFEVATKDKIG